MLNLQLDEALLAEFNETRNQNGLNSACHAPFKSLFIGMRGNIMVCCFNKMYILGTYPEQSLHEIWFGERANKLRREIQNNNFALGCQGCYNLIKAKNFGNIALKKFDHLGTNEAHYPTRIDFELSNECNLECIMCRGEFSSSIRRNREKLPPIPSPYNDEFVRQLEEFIPYLEGSHFLGGEPFMIPTYHSIWDKMIELNPDIQLSVQTNATLLTSRIKNILESKPFSISVSIDSIEKDNYERIRKNGVFSKVMGNIRFFRDYCTEKGTSLNISYCPMPQNLHELPEVIQFCNDLNAQVHFNTVTFPYECSPTSMASGELGAVIEQLNSANLPQQTATEKYNLEQFKGISSLLEFWKEEVITKETSPLKDTNLKDIQDYLEGLKIFIEQSPDYSSITDFYEEIEEKLLFVLQTADGNQVLPEAEQKMMEVDYKTVCESVPVTDKVALVGLFNAYMTPIL